MGKNISENVAGRIFYSEISNTNFHVKIPSLIAPRVVSGLGSFDGGGVVEGEG